MRYLVCVLALVGALVAGLALHVHYSNDSEPCNINARWDCGIVNHSEFAEIYHMPVAAIGVGGYILLAALALWNRRGWVLLGTFVGLLYSLRLTWIEKHILQVWCLYCVISQAIIAFLAIVALIWWWSERRIQSDR
jgi:vitamin-K-epoxide reductase (warfarin-sensitive)